MEMEYPPSLSSSMHLPSGYDYVTVCHGKSAFLIAKPSISMGHLYHGELLVNDFPIGQMGLPRLRGRQCVPRQRRSQPTWEKSQIVVSNWGGRMNQSLHCTGGSIKLSRSSRIVAKRFKRSKASIINLLLIVV